MSIRFEEIENPLKKLSLKYALDQSSYTLRDYNNEETAIKNRQRVSAITITTEYDFIHSLKLCNAPGYRNYAEYVRQKFESIKTWTTENIFHL